jgi:transposase InsO family protein
VVSKRVSGQRSLPGDLLNRDFSAPAPNQIWVTDFTYVPVYSGFVYVALVIDLYSRAIVGWETSTVKDTAFVEHCLRMALWRREQTGRPVPAGLIHHSDAGSQAVFNRSKQQLLAGLSLAGPRRLPLGCAILGRRAAGC